MMPHAPASLSEVLLHLELPSLLGEGGESVSLFFLGRNCGEWGWEWWGQVSNSVILEANPARLAQSSLILRARPSAGAAVTPAGRGRGGCGLRWPNADARQFLGATVHCPSEPPLDPRWPQRGGRACLTSSPVAEAGPQALG